MIALLIPRVRVRYGASPPRNMAALQLSVWRNYIAAWLGGIFILRDPVKIQARFTRIRKVGRASRCRQHNERRPMALFINIARRATALLHIAFEARATLRGFLDYPRSLVAYVRPRRPFPTPTRQRPGRSPLSPFVRR